MYPKKMMLYNLLHLVALTGAICAIRTLEPMANRAMYRITYLSGRITDRYEDGPEMTKYIFRLTYDDRYIGVFETDRCISSLFDNKALIADLRASSFCFDTANHFHPSDEVVLKAFQLLFPARSSLAHPVFPVTDNSRLISIVIYFLSSLPLNGNAKVHVARQLLNVCSLSLPLFAEVLMVSSKSMFNLFLIDPPQYTSSLMSKMVRIVADKIEMELKTSNNRNQFVINFLQLLADLSTATRAARSANIIPSFLQLYFRLINLLRTEDVLNMKEEERTKLLTMLDAEFVHFNIRMIPEMNDNFIIFIEKAFEKQNNGKAHVQKSPSTSLTLYFEKTVWCRLEKLLGSLHPILAFLSKFIRIVHARRMEIRMFNTNSVDYKTITVENSKYVLGLDTAVTSQYGLLELHPYPNSSTWKKVVKASLPAELSDAVLLGEDNLTQDVLDFVLMFPALKTLILHASALDEKYVSSLTILQNQVKLVILFQDHTGPIPATLMRILYELKPSKIVLSYSEKSGGIPHLSTKTWKSIYSICLNIKVKALAITGCFLCPEAYKELGNLSLREFQMTPHLGTDRKTRKKAHKLAVKVYSNVNSENKLYESISMLIAPYISSIDEGLMHNLLNSKLIYFAMDCFENQQMLEEVYTKYGEFLQRLHLLYLVFDKAKQSDAEILSNLKLRTLYLTVHNSSPGFICHLLDKNKALFKSLQVFKLFLNCKRNEVLGKKDEVALRMLKKRGCYIYMNSNVVEPSSETMVVGCDASRNS